LSTLAFEAGTSAAGKPRPPNSRAAKMLATRLEVAQKGRMAQSFAQVVAVLMRDPQFRNLRVVDLEWLVLPPIMAGQFRVGHASRQPEAGKAQRGGVAIPVAVALWARVSPQIDQRLAELRARSQAAASRSRRSTARSGSSATAKSTTTVNCVPGSKPTAIAF